MRHTTNGGDGNQGQRLYPELDACRFDYGAIQLIRHWLVDAVWTGPHDNPRLNESLDKAKAELDQVLADCDWTGAMLRYQRGWRLDQFESLATTSVHAERITDRQYWETLGLLLIDQEDCYRQRDAYRRLLLKTKRSSKLREFLMESREREAFAALPDRLLVYRGCQRFNRKGWHWTLDIDKAKWFSKRCPGERPIILEGQVAKKHVLAYFTRRKERDILIDPRNVEAIKEVAPGPTV
jgi:hypothetical protein